MKSLNYVPKDTIGQITKSLFAVETARFFVLFFFFLMSGGSTHKYAISAKLYVDIELLDLHQLKTFKVYFVLV